MPVCVCLHFSKLVLERVGISHCERFRLHVRKKAQSSWLAGEHVLGSLDRSLQPCHSAALSQGTLLLRCSRKADGTPWTASSRPHVAPHDEHGCLLAMETLAATSF